MRLSAASGSMMSHIGNTHSFAAERMLHPENGSAMRAVSLGAHAVPAGAVYYAPILDARPYTIASQGSHTGSQRAVVDRHLLQTCLEER